MPAGGEHTLASTAATTTTSTAGRCIALTGMADIAQGRRHLRDRDMGWIKLYRSGVVRKRNSNIGSRRGFLQRALDLIDSIGIFHRGNLEYDGFHSILVN